MGTKHCGRIYEWTNTFDRKGTEELQKGTEELQKLISLGLGGRREDIPMRE